MLKRIIQLTGGLFLFAAGIYVSIQANTGLAPWEAFHSGVALHTGLSFGNVSVLTSIVILAITMLLREPVGIGTLLNSVLIGKFVDLLRWLNPLPLVHTLWLGLAVLLGGLVLICLGSYFYLRPALGAGPRDTLMTALAKRWPNVPVGAVRVLIEGTALLLGWLLGARVGIGTVVAAFGIGLILELTFRLLRFDVKSVRHESLGMTLQSLRQGE